MAEHALGNDEAADSALARAEEIAPGLGSMHTEAESSGMGDMLRARDSMMDAMPEGHPPIDSGAMDEGGTEDDGGADEATSSATAGSPHR